MKDGIPGGLQHRHKMCYKKGGYYGRWACMIWRWFHHRDVISRRVNLHMTLIYTRLLVYVIVLLIYPKDHVLSIMLICIKHIIMTLFLSRTFHHVPL